MKLFVFATLVVAACGGRLELLGRSYLPPDNIAQGGDGFGPESNRFGISGHGLNGVSDGFVSNRHGAPLSSNGFGVPHGSNSNGLSGNSFEGATFNKYLPPDHGPSRVFGSNGFGIFSGLSRLGSQPQISIASRQYLAPRYTSAQQAPHQPFDEHSGYIY